MCLIGKLPILNLFWKSYCSWEFVSFLDLFSPLRFFTYGPGQRTISIFSLSLFFNQNLKNHLVQKDRPKIYLNLWLEKENPSEMKESVWPSHQQLLSPLGKYRGFVWWLVFRTYCKYGTLLKSNSIKWKRLPQNHLNRLFFLLFYINIPVCIMTWCVYCCTDWFDSSHSCQLNALLFVLIL